MNEAGPTATAGPRLRSENHLAAGFAGVDRTVSLGYLLEREHPGDVGAQAAVAEEVSKMAETFAVVADQDSVQ